VLSTAPIRIDDGVDTAQLNVEATPPDAEVRYRLDPRASWLSVPGGLRGSFRAASMFPLARAVWAARAVSPAPPAWLRPRSRFPRFHS